MGVDGFEPSKLSQQIYRATNPVVMRFYLHYTANIYTQKHTNLYDWRSKRRSRNKMCCKYFYKKEVKTP